ncbi:MAG: DUF790 family protein [Sandaracinaceae bacterium]
MLTADLVHTRRQKGTLKLLPLNDERRARALDLAAELIEIAEMHVGLTRAELTEAWSQIDANARDRKLALGLQKLVEDRLIFEVAFDTDPVELRREVFTRAAGLRREAGLERFDPAALLAEIAEAKGVSGEEVSRALFADLKSEHRVAGIEAPPPRALVEAYDLEQARAVLLRAVRLRARIRGASPESLRSLFATLKFRRLLFSAHRDPDGALRLEIDGPMSLFDAVTKYGLALAMALPAICGCGGWSIEADLRWGKKREPLRFALDGPALSRPEAPARARDEIETLLERFAARTSKWTVAPADDVLDLPGVGLCVPDLAFTHAETGECVLFEALGYWSRDAVWRRVELVERGLAQKILFAVSSRLRVSESVLDPDASGALYVYKGTMSAAQIEERLDRLAQPG